jgi:transcription elongation GreA/GreB family factor
MNKTELVQRIVAQLTHDLDVFFTAAKTAHQAATHAENQPDNKYDTLALEASYVAQGQANRAWELRQSIHMYRQLTLVSDGETVCLTSLVTIEAEDGTRKTVFIGPLEGGLKIEYDNTEIMVISPTSPLGKGLIGKCPGDTAVIWTGSRAIEYEIVAVS